MLLAFGHPVATFCDVLGVVSSPFPKKTQHIAAHRNKVAKRTQHFVPNNVALACCDRLAWTLYF